MKKIFLLMVLAFTLEQAHAQFIHKIKADSVLITNDSCTAELNLENSTKHIKGFLYNKGNGRTEFRIGLLKLNDTLYLAGEDTLNFNFFRQGGNTFGAMGVLGTNDNYPMLFKQNNTPFLSTYGNKNILMGGFASKMDSAIDENVLIGSPEFNATKLVQRNVAIGSAVFDSAGHWTNQAYGNVVIGRASGRRINSDYNVVIGAGALAKYKDTSGYYGVGSYGGNVAIGYYALEHNVYGNSNIGIGVESGANVNGSGNIYLGYWNAYNQSSQSVNQSHQDVIMIGSQHNWNAGAVTLSNTTILGGRRVNTTLSNVVIIGGTYPASQNVLIGRYNVNSGEKLQVEGAGLFTQTLKAGGTGSNAFQIANSFTPSSSADPAGSSGAVAWDNNYIYIKTSAGWKRAALSTF